ncbi:MAG: hypothetical protein V3U88_01230 [Methylococcales bacterium]
MALDIATSQNKPIEIVDPKPVKIDYPKTTIHAMTASKYVHNRETELEN